MGTDERLRRPARRPAPPASARTPGTSPRHSPSWPPATRRSAPRVSAWPRVTASRRRAGDAAGNLALARSWRGCRRRSASTARTGTRPTRARPRRRSPSRQALGVAGVNLEDSRRRAPGGAGEFAAKVAAVKDAAPGVFVNARVDTTGSTRRSRWTGRWPARRRTSGPGPTGSSSRASTEPGADPGDHRRRCPVPRQPAARPRESRSPTWPSSAYAGSAPAPCPTAPPWPRPSARPRPSATAHRSPRGRLPRPAGRAHGVRRRGAGRLSGHARISYRGMVSHPSRFRFVEPRSTP